MIWVGGQVVADESLTVSVLDRAFEHGLGLFETLRTWNGQAVFLPRHLARLRRSARQLGLPDDPAHLPDDQDVSALLEAEAAGTDRVLRITLSGGTSSTSGARIWMRSAALATETGPTDVRVGGYWTVDRADPLARHKSLNYWRRRIAHEEGTSSGHYEWLSRSTDGAIWEGSRTNVFTVLGSELSTPPVSGPIVPGILRAWVLERANALGIVVREEEQDEDLLKQADEVFLTNSVRGVIPVAQFLGRARPAPGPLTHALQVSLQKWLSARGNR
jgi:branched-chain amino acid aminotransferase